MNLIKSTSIWGKSENQNNEINVSGVCVAIKYFPCFFKNMNGVSKHKKSTIK